MNNSDRAYKEMLEKKIKTLQSDISTLEKKNKGINILKDHAAEKIERKKLEISKLQEELKDYTERTELGAVSATFVETFDEIVDIHNEKRQDAQAKIQELQELRAKLTTTRARKKIDRKIERQTKLLKQLQKKDNDISGIQRVFMYPKYRKEMKKRQLLSNQEAKVSVSQANINDIEQMQAMLNPNNSFIDGIKDTIYEIKKSHYKRKMNRAAEILNVMQKCDSPILMRGAAPIVISKRLKDKFAAKLQKDQMLLDAAKNNVQSQNMIAATAK